MFLSSWYPSRVHHTLGNFVQRHAQAVANMHHVHVLTVVTDAAMQSSLEIVSVQHENVQETTVYFKKGMFKKLQRWNAFRNGIEHLKKKGQFHFDLVHLNVIWPDGWQALYLNRQYDLPYVITEHWTGYDTTVRKHPGRLCAVLSKQVTLKAELVCPVTQNLAAAMQQFGLKGGYAVVPNVVDTSLFQVGKKPVDTVHFLHVSSLVDEHKNISGLLKAWKKTTEIRQGIHLGIGGDGPILWVQRLAEKLQIPSGTITFFSEKSLAEIAEMMQKSHCLVLFSNYENLPCVIVEALASGMAVISTDVGGISEHINPARGYLVTRGDEKALTEHLAMFADQAATFDGVELRNYAEKHFSVESIARQFDKIYSEVLRKVVREK